MIRCEMGVCAVVMWMVGAASAAPYGDAVLATDGLVLFYRMNSDPAEIGDALINEASPGTLDGVWGYDDGNPDSLPLSGIEGPRPASGFGGLEAENVGAFFGGNFADDNEDGTTEDNIADQMDLADPEFIDALDNEFATLALFVKTDVVGNDGRLFTTAVDATHIFRLVYGVSDFTGKGLEDYGAIAVATGPEFDDPASNQQTRGAVFNDDQWHHIVVVRNGDDARNVQFYYDGQDISGEMVDVGDNYGVSNETPRIGARHGTDNPGNGAYQGNLDEFAYWNRALTAGEVQGLYEAALGDTAPVLQAGDANMDRSFDQFDIIQVQQASKYLTGQPATWGDGDWNGAPGGSPGSPPPGDGVFDQLDIVSALAAGLYLQGPYAAIAVNGQAGDAQTSVGYDAATGLAWVDAPAGKDLTSINIPVPEPSTCALLALGLAACCWMGRAIRTC